MEIQFLKLLFSKEKNFHLFKFSPQKNRLYNTQYSRFRLCSLSRLHQYRHYAMSFGPLYVIGRFVLSFLNVFLKKIAVQNSLES
jgi:hypothetical protein